MPRLARAITSGADVIRALLIRLIRGADLGNLDYPFVTLMNRKTLYVIKVSQGALQK